MKQEGMVILNPEKTEEVLKQVRDVIKEDQSYMDKLKLRHKEEITYLRKQFFFFGPVISYRVPYDRWSFQAESIWIQMKATKLRINDLKRFENLLLIDDDLGEKVVPKQWIQMI